MDKFTRQLNLVALLEQAGNDLTFAEIRERLRSEAYPQRDPESARRAFERDKADLLQMGVPLESRSPGDDPSRTVYGIRPSAAEIEDPGFTPEELAALRFAATALALRSEDSTTMEDAVDGLRKYGGLGADEPTRTVAELSLDRNVRTIFTAILERRPVGFTYGAETRRVLPLQLASRAGHWYLRCLHVDGGHSRTYRLDRIEGTVLPLEGEGEDPAEPTPTGGAAPGDAPGENAPVERGPVGSLRFRPWEFGEGEPLRALVRLDPAAAAVALAGDPDLAVHTKGPDGTVIALEVRNPEGLWPWLLAFLERAELTAPASLRSDYADLLRSMARADVEESG